MNPFNPNWAKSQTRLPSSSQIQIPYTDYNNYNNYNNYSAGMLLSSSSDTLETTTPTSSCKSFNHSSDSLNSFTFEDYRITNGFGVNNPTLSSTPSAVTGTYVYFKCAIPTSRESFTLDFIKTMCCNCGRGS
jgi:hypothetical protein